MYRFVSSIRASPRLFISDLLVHDVYTTLRQEGASSPTVADAVPISRQVHQRGTEWNGSDG